MIYNTGYRIQCPKSALTLFAFRNDTCTHHFNKPIVIVVVVATLLSWTPLLQNFSLVGMKVRLWSWEIQSPCLAYLYLTKIHIKSVKIWEHSANVKKRVIQRCRHWILLNRTKTNLRFLKLTLSKTLKVKCVINSFKKSCIWETPNLLTDADSFTNTFFSLRYCRLISCQLFHQKIAVYGPLKSYALQSLELCLSDQHSE